MRALENAPLSGDSIQHQTPSGTTLYFPDYVDGGGWSMRLALSNPDTRRNAPVVVTAYDPQGREVSGLFDSGNRFEIPSLGSRVLRSAGSGVIRRGWIQVEADADTVRGLLFYLHAPSGIEVGVKPVELGSQFALFVEESPSAGAGVAFFKPDSTSDVELRIRGEEGTDPLNGGFVSWRDSHQAALTLPEWFTVEGVDTEFLGNFRGFLFLRSEDHHPFAPLGLRFGKQISSLSAMPVIRVPDGGGPRRRPPASADDDRGRPRVRRRAPSRRQERTDSPPWRNATGPATRSRRPRSASWQVGGSERSPGAPSTSPSSFVFSTRRVSLFPA